MDNRPSAPAQPVIVAAPRPLFLGSEPSRVTCPFCHAGITTKVQPEPNAMTHCMALVMCFTCCLGCIPYCVDSCQSTKHYCPNCHAYVGSYGN